jgi:hypothetical protein
MRCEVNGRPAPSPLLRPVTTATGDEDEGPGLLSALAGLEGTFGGNEKATSPAMWPGTKPAIGRCFKSRQFPLPRARLFQRRNDLMLHRLAGHRKKLPVRV